MEDGLRPSLSFDRECYVCLNPCCNGRWSQTLTDATGADIFSLNPCCNGRWSQTELGKEVALGKIPVLILVVMEDGLRLPSLLSILSRVLILVVMEDGLRHSDAHLLKASSLNPCCNGRWSQTSEWEEYIQNKEAS